MMVMMVVVMVVGMRGGVVVNCALLLVAMLFRSFEFKRRVPYSVLAKLISYLVLYLVPVALCNNVHRSIVVYTIYASDMDVMNVTYTFNA